LKRAGFDVVIIEGSSARPVYLWIDDGEAETRSAGHVWGKTTKDTQEIIRQELGDRLVRIVSIGQAGKKLVRFACILNELRFANGRSGFGAVMASKRLKAIATRGHKRIEWKDPEKIRNLARWFGDNWRKYPSTLSRSVFGTSEVVTPLNADGTLPTRNFREGVFEGAEELSGERMKNTILVGSEGRFACPVRCKKSVKGVKPYVTDPSYGGPEYETIAAFGSLCGVNNIGAVALANQLCNAHGMDTISTGAAVAFAVECYEEGILTVEETGGLELNFGTADALVRLVEMSGGEKGLGRRSRRGPLPAITI
jgi:aldehyde:ferredoxin oxidoreductase